MNFATALLPAVTQRLANGLTVILHPIEITDAVTVDVWVKTGGRHESPELLGVSHFLEHMVFKGSERILPGDLDRAVEGRGGITNAATGQDYTHYFITVAADDLADTLPYLAEVVTQAAIPPAEFERERQVVLEEMRRAADNPDFLAYQSLMQTAYPDHPYGRPVLGTVDSLMALTPEAMRDYHRSWYHPDHMTVVIVGRIELTAALALVEAHFGSMPTTPAASKPARILFEPLTTIRRVEVSQPRLEQARLLMAWPTVSIHSWQDACGLELLASLLGDGRTSRLVQLLREQRGWVRGIGCSSMAQQDPGLFTITAYLDPMHLQIVEQTILAEITRLQTELVSVAELERIRRILVNEFIFSTESPHQLASVYGYYDSIGGMPLALDYLERVQTITAAEIQHLAHRFLSIQAYVVTTLKPDIAPTTTAADRELALR